MAGHKGVMDALPRVREAGDAPQLPKPAELLPPPGEDLVGVALVAHVKDELVLRGAECPVQGHSEFDGAKVGGQMPSCF